MQECTYPVNAMNIFTFTNSHLHSFCISLYVRAGSLFERADNNGITHLLEHTIFRNLKKKYDNRFYDLLALHGLDFSGMTYKEFLCFSLEGPASGFDFACQVLCGIFDEIQLDPMAYAFEKRRIKAEIREKDERNALQHLFLRNVWEDTDNNKTVMGYCSVLDKTSLRKLNAYRRQVFTGDNCFVYVTGNVPDAGIATLKDRLAATDIAQIPLHRKNEVRLSDKFFHRNGSVKVKDSTYSAIHFGFDVDTQKHSGAVQDLIYQILLKGDNGLLFQKLSENNPLIYSFDSSYEQYDNVGNIQFDFEIAPDKLEEGICRVVEALQDLKHGRFHFEANLQAEFANWITALDNPSDLNWNLAYYNHILHTDPILYSFDWLGRFQTVTKEQIILAAEDIFRTDNLTIVLEGNRRRIKTDSLGRILDQLNTADTE